MCCFSPSFWHRYAMTLQADDLAKYIDHSFLKPDATKADIDKLCREALAHRFHAVCVNPTRVVQAAAILEDSDIKVVAVIGFPFGATDGDSKRYEAELCIDLGAQEIDAVINIGRLKDGDDKAVFRELRDVVESANGIPVKMILECCLLTDDEKRRACSLVVESGAQFVKTSSGFARAGATVDDVRLLRETVGPKFGVKASGGIRDTATAIAMIEAGASRLGASASVAILEGLLPLTSFPA
jgi:deoxyribose-phosphate aldolase